MKITGKGKGNTPAICYIHLLFRIYTLQLYFNFVSLQFIIEKPFVAHWYSIYLKTIVSDIIYELYDYGFETVNVIIFFKLIELNVEEKCWNQLNFFLCKFALCMYSTTTPLCDKWST